MSVTVIDLPIPPSVNRTRKINWRAHKKVVSFVTNADGCVMMAKRRKDDPLKLEKHRRFQLNLTFSEQLTDVDLDNSLKTLIDYLRRIEAIENDAPANMRRIVIEWGLAPMGVRVEIVPMSVEA
jgi:Holliday junction resolvase RusA-like endonuclease